MRHASERHESDVTAAVGEIDGLPPLERSSLAHRARELIRRAIVDGVLSPGGQVSPREVAARLGVSPTPVREALIHLDAIGLVEFLPGRIRIASPTPAALRAAFELREGLEGMAARLAALRRTDDEAMQIRDLAGRSVSAADARDQEQFRFYDASFHRAVGQAARSQWLEQYLSNALDLALTLRNLRVAGQPFTAYAAPLHVAIAEAIKRRDPNGAERASREHVRAVTMQIVPDGDAPS
jgi:DNA-binding GntR family transcriptional regulator